MKTKTTERMKKILIVDDEVDVGMLISNFFNKRGFQAISLENGLLGLRLLLRERFDVLISDIKMPRMDGIEFSKRAKQIDPNMVVILLTGYGSLETAQEAIKIGVKDYLTKPVDIEQLLVSVNEGLRLAEIQKKNFSHYHKLVQSLNKEKDALDAAKENFLALLSHELRTPVTVISEAFSILKEAVDIPTDHEFSMLDEEKKLQAINAFNDGRRRIISIVDDINYYMNLNRGEVSLEKTKVSLNYILNNNNNALVRLASRNKCDLQKQFGDQEIEAVVDPERILDVIARLINNAGFHNSAGTKIILKLLVFKKDDADSQKEYVRIQVCDNGQGIDEKVLENIFSPFNVSDIMHHSRGVGLSFPICKKVIELHGGTMKVESIKGQGTTITIEIPKE